MDHNWAVELSEAVKEKIQKALKESMANLDLNHIINKREANDEVPKSKLFHKVHFSRNQKNPEKEM